jgi:hypothetical protein
MSRCGTKESVEENVTDEDESRFYTPRADEFARQDRTFHRAMDDEIEAAADRRHCDERGPLRNIPLHRDYIASAQTEDEEAGDEKAAKQQSVYDIEDIDFESEDEEERLRFSSFPCVSRSEEDGCSFATPMLGNAAHLQSRPNPPGRARGFAGGGGGGNGAINGRGELSSLSASFYENSSESIGPSASAAFLNEPVPVFRLFWALPAMPPGSSGSILPARSGGMPPAHPTKANGLASEPPLPEFFSPLPQGLMNAPTLPQASQAHCNVLGFLRTLQQSSP